jgi:type II secretory pathway pseudopilin PulG
MFTFKKMKSQIREEQLFAKRGSERGAALLTMLLVAILLLSAGLALLTSTSLSTTNAIDSTAEMQAYAAAEAGLDAALYVLRGNVSPHAPLLAGTKMNFVNAAKPATSNKTGDPQVNISRLSGWLTYTYQNASDSTDWRVPLTSSYSPNSGLAYKITIIDPDDTGLIATRKITTVAGYKPTRLLIQSEGYGPKGAVKRLEMVIEHGAFDFEPKQLISAPGGPGIALNFGSSDPVKYSGIDHGVPPAISIPMIAVDPTNVETVQGKIDALDDDQVEPDTAAALTADNTAPFIRTADEARAFLTLMRGIASNIQCDDPDACSTGRLFPNQDAANAAGDFGTPTNWKTTFIDNYGGDAVKLGPGHQGSGLLIVTGALETNGTTDFQGVILVLGAGTVLRKGGGDGVIGGAIVIANFDPTDPNDDTFGAPSFIVDGGGNSQFVYNSVSVRNALEATGFRVLGVREYH